MLKLRKDQRFDLLKKPLQTRIETNKPGRIYNVKDDEPKDVALRIFKNYRMLENEQIAPNKSEISTQQNLRKPVFDLEYDTESVSYSSSDSNSDKQPPRRPSFIQYRCQKRRRRFLRMANNLFHIKSMEEFCKSAKIKNEKNLIKKYEPLLVRIESGCNELAKDKHEARLLKNQLRRFRYEINTNFVPDESTTYTLNTSAFSDVLSDMELAMF